MKNIIEINDITALELDVYATNIRKCSFFGIMSQIQDFLLQRAQR